MAEVCGVVLLSQIVNTQIIQRFDGELLQQRDQDWIVKSSGDSFKSGDQLWTIPQGQTERWDRKIERIRIFSTHKALLLD